MVGALVGENLLRKIANQNGAMNPVPNLVARWANASGASENLKRFLCAICVSARYIPLYSLGGAAPELDPDDKRPPQALKVGPLDYLYALLDNIGFKDRVKIG